MSKYVQKCSLTWLNMARYGSISRDLAADSVAWGMGWHEAWTEASWRASAQCLCREKDAGRPLSVGGCYV